MPATHDMLLICFGFTDTSASFARVWNFTQAALLKQEARLAAATAELQEAESKLQEKEDELAEVQAQYDASVKTKQVCKKRSADNML